MMNFVGIMGRLVKDPELRHTNNGKAVASFCLAVDRDRKNDKGEREVDFLDCTAWGNTGEFAAKYLSKGQKAVVTGRLQIRLWTDNNDVKRRSAEIVVSSIYFADAPRNSSEGSYPASMDNYGPGTSGVMQDAYAAIGGMQSGFQPLDDDDGEMPF